MVSITTPNPRYFRTSAGLCCFVSLLQVNKDGKFSVDLLWDKSDPCLPLIKAEIDKAGKAKFGNKRWRHPLRDGDEKADQYPEYKGKAYITFRAQPNRPPQVLGPSKQRITDSTQLYSGMFGSALFSIYTYEAENGKNIGVACGLEGFQKVRDGEPLVSRVDATDLFDELEEADNTAALFE